VYNQYQELCKTVDPESGSTLQHFDGAGNVDWTAAGLNLPSFTSCDDTDASVGPRKIVRRYDLRNRLLSLSFPDGQGNQAWEYTLAGQPSKVTTYNTDVSTNNGTQVITSYGYFARGLLKLERLNQPGWYTWGLDYTYDSNAHLSTQTYPSGLIVDYKPNALGEPSQAGNSGPNPYAWGVKYYPNGAIASFSYGNAIRHSMTQNARGLPERSVDQNDSGVAVLDDSYDYDPNGNVAAISDGLASGRGDRTMTYDGLNRLTAVASPMYGAAGAHYAYDVLDNLTHVSVDGAQSRDQYFCYDTSTWRLTNIKTGSCLGATVLGLGYDEQGNVANKSGTVYDFDYGNRLRSASYAGTTLESYRYDGLGRRVLSYSPSLGNILSMYASDGRLIFQQNQRTGLNIDYIYLGGSLVARRERNNSTGIFANRYEHTDALGSPVAVTDGSQSVLERNEYEPYGKVIGASVKDGPGYTGHVADAQTGLDYMQQRYYDPSLGRFMSVDPVGVTETGANFNRFWYGNNNPYRFTDPDGRQSKDEGNFWVGFAKAIHDSIAPLANAMVDPDGTTIDPSTDQLGPGPGQVEQGGYKFGNALVIAETAKLPARVVGSVMPRAVTLTEGQAANLARFNKRLPKGNTGTVVTQGPKGSVTFTSEVPGKVPGSKATYQKTVNRAGETTGMTKTTVDNKGQVPHTKDKFSGSHG
jgi:RHS repeat-associated protein